MIGDCHHLQSGSPSFFWRCACSIHRLNHGLHTISAFTIKKNNKKKQPALLLQFLKQTQHRMEICCGGKKTENQPICKCMQMRQSATLPQSAEPRPDLNTSVNTRVASKQQTFRVPQSQLRRAIVLIWRLSSDDHLCCFFVFFKYINFHLKKKNLPQQTMTRSGAIHYLNLKANDNNNNN